MDLEDLQKKNMKLNVNMKRSKTRKQMVNLGQFDCRADEELAARSALVHGPAPPCAALLLLCAALPTVLSLPSVLCLPIEHHHPLMASRHGTPGGSCCLEPYANPVRCSSALRTGQTRQGQSGRSVPRKSCLESPLSIFLSLCYLLVISIERVIFLVTLAALLQLYSSKNQQKLYDWSIQLSSASCLSDLINICSLE